MKIAKIAVLSFFILIFFNGYSQLALEKVKDSILLDYATTVKLESDSITVLISEKNWDTINFNPYKNYKQEFPFQIKFVNSIFASPISREKVITSRFGWRHGRGHKGIDIDLITGDSVMAILEGKVRFVDYHSGHGKTIVVHHPNGLETVYAHLSKQLVKVNDSVRKGQVIGKGGNTGNSRGSHLHLEVNYNGISINPEYVFDFQEENSIRSADIWIPRKWTTPLAHSSKRQSQIDICYTLEEAELSQNKQKDIYIIKRGDTLSKIASKNYVSIDALCKANAIKRTSTLRVGQKLILGL